MTDYTQARCLDQDPESWYAQAGTRERDHAVATCMGCPVRWGCLEDAIAAESLGDTRHLFGVFGGLPPAERAPLVTPKCVRCHAPRTAFATYCPPCSAKSKAESNARRARDVAS